MSGRQDALDHDEHEFKTLRLSERILVFVRHEACADRVEQIFNIFLLISTWWIRFSVWLTELPFNGLSCNDLENSHSRDKEDVPQGR